jgi:hypothetical protein
VHISYSDDYHGNLKYATNRSGAWAFHVVDEAGNVGQYTSLAIEDDNTIHIGYHGEDALLHAAFPMIYYSK